MFLKSKKKQEAYRKWSPIKDSSSTLTHAQWHSSINMGDEMVSKMSNIDINWLFLSSLN